MREETGVTIRLSVPLDSISYEAGNAGLKKVDYWGGVVLDSVPRAPDAEVDVVSWLPVRAALGRLTYSMIISWCSSTLLSRPPLR